MTGDWKYICLDLEGGTVLLFPPHLAHADVAERFKPSKPVSAGFVGFDGLSNSFTCYGRSDSLKLEPKEEDDFLVNMLLNDN